MFYYGSTERLTIFLSDGLEIHHETLVEESRVFQRWFCGSIDTLTRFLGD